MAGKRKSLIGAFLVVVLAAGGGGAWFLLSARPLADSKDELPANLLAKVERRDIDSKLLLSGEVVPALKMEVKPEVGGKVKEIAVSVGQHVKKGDLLAIIDDTDLQTQKRSAETAIEGTQLTVDKNKGNYDRAKALFDEKLISKEVYANLEADLKISENALEKAQSQLQSVNDSLSKTRIVAPSDGTVLDIQVNEGQVVTAAASVNSGTTLMIFADLSRLLIDTNVNQMDVAKLSAGQEVSVNMQGDDTNSVKARVEFVAPLATVKNNIKGFEVQALIQDNRGTLKPGMSVSMVAPVGSAKGAVSVPISAVFKQDNDRVVYVRKGVSTERRKVRVGLTNMSYAVIVCGLAVGEEILLVEPRDLAGANPT
ncbi:MAG: efflux RND transporter periplasmic adaptor subunit [Terrimicrobiaceae bacterium]|nr:efflux RND transporter periplasmic adaptor subunit [Terrimicrobiaceae bacterium]